MSDDRELRDYLAALDAALRDVPRDGRAEVLRDVRGHVEEARADEPDVPVRVVLDRLGTPDAIAAEARARYGTVPAGRAYGWDVAAVVLLLIGFLVVPVAGWIVGVVLLWTGPRWSLADKLLGTLVWPGGLPFVPLVGAYLSQVTVRAGSSCEEVSGPSASDDAVFECSTFGVDTGSSTPGDLVQVVVFVLALVAPVVVAVHLLRRARRAG